ncbi:MAG: hypothetical protein JSW11_21905 [Candidatus Heimdallarchaeota archaeon]|nr:MAG: hypothetical protein JSW11_21905 [Candidatus Heimdallarchaeota archaeon]
MGTHTIISVMEETFGGIDLPGTCISLVDSDGLVIHNEGECDDLPILESLNAHLITSFENTLMQLISVNQILDSIVLNTGETVYYVDDLTGGTGLYLVIRTKPKLMNKVLPYLKSITKTIELALQAMAQG